MTGYKVFVEKDGKLKSLFYEMPTSWVIREDSVLVDENFDRSDREWAPGINFYRTRDSAEGRAALQRKWHGRETVVFEIEADGKVTLSGGNKARTDRAKLIRKLEKRR